MASIINMNAYHKAISKAYEHTTKAVGTNTLPPAISFQMTINKEWYETGKNNAKETLCNYVRTIRLCFLLLRVRFIH